MGPVRHLVELWWYLGGGYMSEYPARCGAVWELDTHCRPSCRGMSVPVHIATCTVAGGGYHGQHANPCGGFASR